MGQIEFVGTGSFDRLTDVLDGLAVKSIFLVTGKKSYRLCRAEQLVNKKLSEYSFNRFFDFKTNPSLNDVLRGVSEFNSKKFDAIVAIGGGSVIDMAKLINVFSHHQEVDPKDIIKKDKPIATKGVPLIAVPTTAGSGSESTHFAVVYIGKTKYSVAHPSLQPDVAIVDPRFLESQGKRIRASAGMDALCQAIESFWCINSTTESRDLASKAIRLVKDNVLLSGKDILANEKMALAAHMAGKAINITKTTASHAISYAFTSYFNVPHGHAVALTIRELLEFNAGVMDDDCNDSRGRMFVRQRIDEIVSLLDAKSVSEAKKGIKTLMDNLGLETRLSKLGVIKDKHFELIAENINFERLKNNPRVLTKESLLRILENIY